MQTLLAWVTAWRKQTTWEGLLLADQAAPAFAHALCLPVKSGLPSAPRPAAGCAADGARAQPGGPAGGPLRCLPCCLPLALAAACTGVPQATDECAMYGSTPLSAGAACCICGHLLLACFARRCPPARPHCLACPVPPQCTCASSACCTWPTSTAWSSIRCPPWTSCSSAMCPRTSDGDAVPIGCCHALWLQRQLWRSVSGGKSSTQSPCLLWAHVVTVGLQS